MGLLRLALALAVLLTHLPPATYRFMGGGLAVQCFFIVSGFYMALVLEGKYRDAGIFYSKRFLRLAPTYFVAMLLAAVVLFGLGPSATATPEMFAAFYRHPGAALLLGFQNLTLLGQELLFWFKVTGEATFSFDASNAPPSATAAVGWQFLLVPQAWSQSMEIVFYALAPYLARVRSGTLAALALASMALRVAGHWLPVDFGLWQGRLFPTALFLFLLGMLAFRALPLAGRLPVAAAWAANGLVLAIVVALPLLKLNEEVGRWLVYGLVAVAVPLIFNALKDFTLDRWIGELSYPIYLGHLMVVGLVLRYEPPHPVVVAFAGTLALATLLFAFIDRPVDRWRQARARASVTRPVAATAPAGA